MAKWAIVSKVSGALSDICDEADKFEIYVCNICGLIAIANPAENLFMCKNLKVSLCLFF